MERNWEVDEVEGVQSGHSRPMRGQVPSGKRAGAGVAFLSAMMYRELKHVGKDQWITRTVP